jgi:signal transduction histidine kinase
VAGVRSDAHARQGQASGDAAAGAGVSMTIARRIADRHGGSIWAHAGRGDGCTIVVLLPAAA